MLPPLIPWLTYLYIMRSILRDYCDILHRNFNAVPECDPEQCQWEPHPVSSGETQDDRNSPLGSDPLLFSDNG